MDLSSFARELWRHRRYILIAVAAALLVSVLAGYKPTTRGFAPRAAQSYESTASILVGSGQGVLYRNVTPSTVARKSQTTDFADPGQLSDIYAQLVQSDEIKHRVEQVFGRLDSKNATITAFRQVATNPGPSVVGGGRGRPLPFVEIDAEASTPGGARRLALGPLPSPR